MKPIVIVGAGGFGREVHWLIKQINRQREEWNVLGYIDDNVEVGTEINEKKVLGNIDYLLNQKENLSVAIAIGNARVRKQLVEKLSKNLYLEYPNLIAPDVYIDETIQLGKGNIIALGNILTVNIEIEDFNIINLNCTVGHDVKFHNFITVYPGVNISGNVVIGEESELGTNSCIIQGIDIGPETIIGAGSVVIRDIKGGCTVVGNPTRSIKKDKTK